MSTTTVGPRYPSTFGSGGWDNLDRLAADDASYASAYLGPTRYTASDTAAGFSFSSDSIPANAVISELTTAGEWYGSSTGIDFSLQARASGAGSNRGGLVTSSNKTSATAISGTFTTNLPTVAELVSAAFGVWFYAKASAGGKTPYLDYVRLSAKYYVPPTCTTDEATDITGLTATSGGETTDDGSGTISACGVCWNTTGAPTIAGAHTTDDSGIGTYVSALTGLFPSTKYYVRAYATTEDATAYGPQVEFTTSSSSSRSLVARPFTTRAAAAEFVARQGDGIIDWWVDDDVVRAEIRPTDVADIPRSRWYVASAETPGVAVSVTRDDEDRPDILCVVYRTYGVTNVRDGSVRRVYYPAAPTTAIQRVSLVDLTGQYMGEADASSYAANLWLRSCAEALTGTVTARGGLRTVDGQFVPAPLICAGDWIDLVDLPGHAPVYMTGTTYSRATQVVSITVGSTEQRELVIPGMSALPQALQVYGQAAEVYDTGPSDPSYPYDPYGPDPPPDVPDDPYDPGGKDFKPGVTPGPGSHPQPPGGPIDWDAPGSFS